MSKAQDAQRRKNVIAIAAKRRAVTHCKYGHELSGYNLIIKPDGRRQCRRCKNDAHGLRLVRVEVALKLNPNHPLHGTATGARTKCRCHRCRLMKIEKYRQRNERRHAQK